MISSSFIFFGGLSSRGSKLRHTLTGKPRQAPLVSRRPAGPT